ncbi:penicillin-binding transpeptidase domain-containing protein [Planotetraspora sp. GP83]|uniref:penicillin-binding transpeptidase domain-containing protein n=1 Tax=Planotetraspora sp. GP83 TaxID=3156264 RepID=UPI00351487B9
MTNRMRKRVLLALMTVAATIFLSGVLGLIVSARQRPAAAPFEATPSTLSAAPSATPARTLTLTVEGSPEETAASYLRAWASGDYESMREMTDEPPADFVDQHRQFEEALDAESVRLTPGQAVKTGDETADVPFTESRDMKGHGPWAFDSMLHLAVRDLTWKVVWSPAVLHPRLAEGGHIVRSTPTAPPSRLVTREGQEFPEANDAEPYLASLNRKLPAPEAGTPVGWAVVVANPGQPEIPLLDYAPAAPKGVRTTIEWPVQASAARALDGVQNPAAVVAVRPSTGEIVAVADRLGDHKAFEQKYAPGSTFKTITAAALLNAGMSPDDSVECPATYTIPNGRRIDNFRGEDHGTISLREAYALSCNTTFARLAVERLNPDVLVDEARAFGFGVPLATGAGGTCGSLTRPENNDGLAEDSFGQGTVEATPLCMALVAAAVESGVWRPPHLMPTGAGDVPGDDPQPESVTLPQGVADGLRGLMSAVTTDGTAAGAGLPEGVSGKTGTAEDWQHGADHAWFIGYRGDLAFAVFVEHGGTGRNAAVPIAARFLSAL